MTHLKSQNKSKSDDLPASVQGNRRLPDRIATPIKNFEVGRTLEMEPIKHVLYTTVDVVLCMRARSALQVFYDRIFKRAQMP